MTGELDRVSQTLRESQAKVVAMEAEKAAAAEEAKRLAAEAAMTVRARLGLEELGGTSVFSKLG